MVAWVRSRDRGATGLAFGQSLRTGRAGNRVNGTCHKASVMLLTQGSEWGTKRTQASKCGSFLGPSQCVKVACLMGE